MSQEREKQFISIPDKHAPYRQKKVKNSYAPYIDKELRHKMFLRDLYTKHLIRIKILKIGKNSKNSETQLTKRDQKRNNYFSQKYLMRLRTISRIPGKY